MRYCCELTGYFHDVNAGSNPAGDANEFNSLREVCASCPGRRGNVQQPVNKWFGDRAWIEIDRAHEQGNNR